MYPAGMSERSDVEGSLDKAILVKELVLARHNISSFLRSIASPTDSVLKVLRTGGGLSPYRALLSSTFCEEGATSPPSPLVFRRIYWAEPSVSLKQTRCLCPQKHYAGRLAHPPSQSNL